MVIYLMTGNNTSETSDFADTRLSFSSREGVLLSPPLPVFLGKKLLQNKWNNWIFVLFSFPAFWLYKNKQKQSFGMFCKKGVLKTFAKFTGKHLRWSLFFHKVADLSPATLLIERLWDRCFPANFANFLKTSTFIQHFWWLLPLRDVLDI